MKITRMPWRYPFALIGANLILFCSCNDRKAPVLSTSEVTIISQTTAYSGGTIIDDGGATITAHGVCWSKSQNPTIIHSKTEAGKGAGSFTSRISGLEPNTIYYVRAYATNSEGTGYGSAMSFTTLKEVSDADGNVYSTVVIGNQEWFAENLRTTNYNDGTPIPNVTSNIDWSNLTSGAYAWYNNDEAKIKNNYGALYNWYAVETGYLCPTGWHVPTGAEWITLADYAGGSQVAGGKLKSTRTAPDDPPRWDFPNIGATDEYGFSALPEGLRSGHDGSFHFFGSDGIWWSSTESSTEPYFRYVYNDVSFLGSSRGHSKGFGFSVRCVKDK